MYAKAVENFAALKARAPLVLEDAPSLYVYRLRMGQHVQTGIAGCFSVAEYETDIIKKHERTRRDKEDDRTRHIIGATRPDGAGISDTLRLAGSGCGRDPRDRRRPRLAALFDARKRRPCSISTRSMAWSTRSGEPTERSSASWWPRLRRCRPCI